MTCSHNIFAHSHEISGRRHINLSACPMKDFRYQSHKSATTDGNYKKKLLPVSPKTVTRRKKKRKKNQNDNLKAICVTRKRKNAKIISIFTTQNGELLTNCRLPLLLPCFSKKLKRIVSNRLFSYLNEKGHLLKNQFGFRHCMSIGHPILS